MLVFINYCLDTNSYPRLIYQQDNKIFKNTKPKINTDNKKDQTKKPSNLITVVHIH